MDASSGIGRGGFKWKLERESRPQTGTFAVDPEGAAQFTRRERATVQAKPMAIFPRGETMTEDSSQILVRNSNAVVRNGNSDPTVYIGNTHIQVLIDSARIVARVFGVIDQIDQNLEDFMFFYSN